MKILLKQLHSNFQFLLFFYLRPFQHMFVYAFSLFAPYGSYFLELVSLWSLVLSGGTGLYIFNCKKFGFYTDSTHLHRQYTVTRTVHIYTESTHLHREYTFTQTVHIYTGSTHLHRQYTFTQTVHIYTDSTHLHRQYTFTQRVHIYTESTHVHRQYTFTQTVHIHGH
jgi:galactitol-specific phosphotransferase system IIB component